MEQLPAWLTLAFGIGGLFGSLATAIATIFLWRVTKTLAIETTRMAEASAQPHIVATMSPNRWSMRHFDLHVDNTGNATAYDIKVSFDPPLQNGEARGVNIEIPLQNISVLKPGQGLSSYLSEYEPLKGKAFRVEISWRKNHGSSERQSNIYTLNMADNDGISRLGDEPLVQIANHVKKLEESLGAVAKGSKRVKLDVFSSSDRLHERRVASRQRRAWQQQHGRAAAGNTPVQETPAAPTGGDPAPSSET